MLSEAESKPGIVYVLTNPAMPNLIKIGFTNHEDVKVRMAQLYSNPGVPLPFECVYAAKVSSALRVEKALHVAFGPDRINPRREFFEIEPAQAIAIIRLLEIEDVTPKVLQQREEVDEVDREAGEAYAKKKRPRMNFQEMGIPVDSDLISVDTGEIVKVVSDRLINFRGEVTSLTNATRLMLSISYQTAPGPYWTYNGRRLRDIYNETYQSTE